MGNWQTMTESLLITSHNDELILFGSRFALHVAKRNTTNVGERNLEQWY
jgi:hypothetical protein